MTQSAPARTRLAGEAVSVVAAAATGRFIVIGSLPPSGRDLDLLVRKPERDRLERALTSHGFVRRGSTFARFESFSAYGVELIDAEGFLAPEPLADLYAGALPVGGFEPLVRPHPGHALLILARIVSQQGRLPPKRRARLERILAEDPGAWARARQAAPSWDASPELAHLEELVAGRVRHRRPPLRRALRAAQVRRRAPLVTLSGLDGSGKSSQARWLADALTELGVEVEVVWNDLQGNIVLDVLGVPTKTLLRLRGRVPEQMASYAESTPSSEHRDQTARRVWSSIVTLANSLEQTVLVNRGRIRGRTIVFDRGPLDLAVRMEVLYRTGIARPRRLVKLAGPRSELAFLLEVAPGVALGRKRDIWSHSQLQEQAALYRALAPSFGARRIDGTRPPEEIAAEIAGTVWQNLG